MYFEDEKENMRNGSAFDDLDVDIDGDDKSVTWDDLLNDDADIMEELKGLTPEQLKALIAMVKKS